MPRLELTTGASSTLESEAVVDVELDQFNEYFKGLQADRIGLTGPERAIIKTFCAYLLGLGDGNPRSTSTNQGKSNA